MPDLRRILPRTHRAVRTLVATRRNWVLVVIASGWFMSLGTRLVFPAILPQLRAAFDLDLAAAGLFLTTIWVAYALGQLPGGILGDRIGERLTLAASTALSGVAILVLVLSPSAVGLFATGFLFGLVTAFFGTTRLTAVADVFPDRAGTAIGLTNAAGNVGNSVLPITAGIVTGVLSWRFGLGITIPLFVLVGVGIWVVVPRRTNPAESAADTLTLPAAWEILAGVGERSVFVVTIITILIFFVWQGFTGFYPTFLIENKGLPPEVAVLLFGLFFATGIVVEPISGAGRDLLGTRRALGIVITVQILSLSALPFVDNLPLLIVVTVLLSSVLGTTAITLAHLATELPSSVQGSALGLIRTVYMVLGALGPIVVGVMADTGFFGEAFLLLAGIAGLALVLTILVLE